MRGPDIAEATRALALDHDVEAVIHALYDDGDLSPQTLDRLAALMRQFAKYARTSDTTTALDAVTPQLVAAYVAAPTSDGEAPGTSLQHFRRLAVRVMFRVGRQLSLTNGDPTLDLVLARRERAGFRALEDDEVELCRAAAISSPRRGRAAAAWALCEATARTGELPGVTRADIDVDVGRVWIAGTPRTLARWGHLTEWGLQQVRRHLAALPDRADTRLICGDHPDAALAQSSAVGVISRTLTHAGLGEARDIRPSSVAAWAGRRVFDETGRIDIAARRLGIRSLDRAAAFIGWEWDAADE